MSKVNWGIIGLGNVANTFSNSIKNCKFANLKAVASLDFQKLNNYKKVFNLNNKYCFNEYRKLLECKEVDIVYIALPNSFHFQWINEALNYNKNILVEKPIVDNNSNLSEIKKKILSKKIFFMEGFAYRFLPHINFVVNFIKHGNIGNLKSMRSNFGTKLIKKKFFGLIKKKVDYQSRYFNKKLGGGCILDLGSYPASLSLLISNIKKNFCKFKLLQKSVEFLPNDVDINAELTLLFDNNFQSKISASFIKNLGRQTVINGEYGELIIQDSWTSQNSIVKFNDKVIFSEKTSFDAFYYEINEISQSILDGKKICNYPAMTFNESMQNMEILKQWMTR